MPSRSGLPLLIAALVTAAAVGQTIASAGTFPGTNGTIAFASEGHIEVINADGSGRVTLDAASPASSVNEPAWNATGTKLVFRDSGSSFSTMNADGSNVKPLVGMPSFAGNPTWSADGSVVAFDGYIGGPGQETRIYVVPSGGGTATELLVGVNAADPTYSPDSTKIAFENRAGGCCDIGVMDSDGTNAATITSGPSGNAGDQDPSWSPDGSKIAFKRSAQIWTVNADGSGAIQLTTGADASYPTWSPDGTQIAFQRDLDIWVMDNDGSNATNITNTAEVEDREPDWGTEEITLPTEGIEFSADAFMGSENGDTRTSRGVVITVVRTGSTAGVASVAFSTTDGTADSSNARSCRSCNVSPPDYLKASGTLVFNDGETTKTFLVPIIDDGSIESDETVNLKLRSGKGGAALGTRSTAVLTISDNDPNISFERAASSGPEAEGPRLNVLLSSPVNGATVAYSVIGGTATAGDDYTLAAGTLRFGTRSTRIPLKVVDEDLKEESETVRVELSAPTNAELGPITEHTYTIKDDDPQGDVAGDTVTSALVVDLVEQPRQVIREFLSPANSDVDLFRVHLEAGDDLAIDVDPAGMHDFYGNLITGLQSSTVAILGPDGTTEIAVVGGSEEPDGTGPTSNPAHLFHAETEGDYYLRLSSPQSGERRGYRIEMHRLALAEGAQDPTVLDDDGPMFAWLHGDMLAITGPTGYGFGLKGAWTKETTTKGPDTSSTIYRLAQDEDVTLVSALGELQMGVASDLVVKTQANRWGDVFGQVSGSSIPARVTVPLGAFSNEFADVFGLVFEQQSGVEIDTWTIELGSNILSSAVGDSRDIQELLKGIPYFYSIDKAPAGGPTFRVKFGPIDNTTKQNGTILIVDPTDPFFYINFISGPTHLVVANSSNGYVPFHPSLPPTLPEADVGLADFYGHSFAIAEAPIFELFPGAKPDSFAADARLTLGATRNIDLDADDDGTFLAGSGNAHQLLSGDLSAIEDVLRDVNIGANGKVSFIFKKSPFNFDVQLGEASFIYNGQEGSVWFRARKGVENPLAGTPFDFLGMGPQDEFEGIFFDDGRFSVIGGTLFDGPGDTELEIKLSLDNDDGITADVRGDVKLKGSATIGGVKGECTASADARGQLGFSYSDQLHMSGSVELDGSVVCKANGHKIGSASIHLSGAVDDGKISFSLPLIGKKSITLF